MDYKEDSGEDEAIFDLSMTDSELLTMTKKHYNESSAYWEDEFGLKKVREHNMNLWLPNHYKAIDLYDYQEENAYLDPRIFVSTEMICSVVNARIPQPTTVPAQNNPISIQTAEDLSKAMFAHSEKFQTNDLFRIATRNLILKRVGYIKLVFNPTVGKFGDIVPEVIQPEDIIPDKNAKWGEIPRQLTHRIRNKTYAELAAIFPDAEQKIYELAGSTRRDKTGSLVAYKSQLSKTCTVMETWIRYVEDGKMASGVVWTDEKFNAVLGKMRNPNWNYEDQDDPEMSGNILDEPEPPFVTFNFMNDGSSYIDVTSLPEQSSNMQRILNKRGFQIMDNADQAGSGIVFNTDMITKEDISKLSGSPDERVGVKGDVRAGMMRVPPPMLPAYVHEDKLDARYEIDDIWGTHGITRGAESNNNTLGQDQLQVNQDYTRMDDVSRAVLRAAVKYYRMLAQMMKVNYTEEHWFKTMGEDGKFDFIMMKNDRIEDGIDVQVQEGSNRPLNSNEQKKFASELAQMGMLDPLTLYEVGSGMPLPTPKKMLERLMAFKTDPMGFAGMAAKDEFDQQALKDIQILNAADIPEIPDVVTPEYINFFNKYMLTADYQKAIKGNPMVQQLYAIHLQRVQQIAQAQLALEQTQMPTQDQLDQQAQKDQQRQAMQPEQGGAPEESTSQKPNERPPGVEQQAAKALNR